MKAGSGRLARLGKAMVAEARACSLPRNMLRYVIIGLAIRLALAPWTSWPFDMYPFYRSSTDILAGLGPYGHLTFAYPPLFAVVLHPFTLILSLFISPAEFGALEPSMVEVSQLTGMLVPFITHPAFNLAVKLPLILADLAVGVILYRFVERRRDAEAAKAAFLLWFLNPLVIWVSSVYANFDVFPAMLTLVAMIAFMRGSYAVSGMALGVGFFFKLYPAYLILFYLALLLLRTMRSRDRDDAISSASFAGGGAASAVTVLPFVLLSDSMNAFMVDRLSNQWFGGLNLWFEIPLIFDRLGGSEGPGLLRWLPFEVDLTMLPGILSTSLLLLIVALTIYLAYRYHLEGGDMVRMNTLVIAGILILQPVTNAHYLLWLLPFIIILTVEDGGMMPKLALLTVSGVLYWLILQSPLAFLYPLAEHTSVVSVEAINRGIEAYFTSPGGLSPSMALAVPSAMGVIALVSLFLPRRIDPIDRAVAWARERWGWA